MNIDNQRQQIRSGARWEPIAGYSRAIRAGEFVAVSGTTAVSADGKLMGAGDPYAQAKRCFELIEAALREAGGSLADVIRTRMYVTDIEQFEAFAKAHREAFDGINPAATMVEVARLVDPDMLIEIEADAILSATV